VWRRNVRFCSNKTIDDCDYNDDDGDEADPAERLQPPMEEAMVVTWCRHDGDIVA